MSHPAGLPDIFLDRSLGRLRVPARLRASGLRVVTLAEHYGIPADEAVPDNAWLRLTAQRGWIAFTKDRRIRTREGRFIRQFGARCFCVDPSAGLDADEVADRFLRSLPAIVSACAETGPLYYAVRRDRILGQSL